MNDTITISKEEYKLYQKLFTSAHDYFMSKHDTEFRKLYPAELAEKEMQDNCYKLIDFINENSGE